MTLPKVGRLALASVALLLLSNCTEDPISTSLNETSLNLADTVFYDFDSYTYQVPPNMGSYHKLYFGSDSDYSIPFSLLNLGATSTDNSVNFLMLSDSAEYMVDSMFLYLVTQDTLLPDLTETYRIASFPAADFDSVFSEKTNYSNITNEQEILDRFSHFIAESEIEKNDSTVTGLTFLKFDLTAVKDSLVAEFSDTTGGIKNRSFVVWRESPTEGISSFYSANSNVNRPWLEVNYRRESGVDTVIVDTLSKIFRFDKDISLIYPPEISSEDTTGISLGLAKGLQSFLKVNIEDHNIPQSAVVRSAELILFSDSTATDFSDFTVGIYVTDTTAILNRFEETDPLTGKQVEITDSSVDGTSVTFDLRTLLQGVLLEQLDEHGLKLYSSSVNSPFEIARFVYSNDSSNAFCPRMRVIYVAP